MLDIIGSCSSEWAFRWLDSYTRHRNNERLRWHGDGDGSRYAQAPAQAQAFQSLTIDPFIAALRPLHCTKLQVTAAALVEAAPTSTRYCHLVGITHL